MKTTFFNKFVLTSLMLAFVAGCGKDQKTGSTPPPPAPVPVVNPSLVNPITTPATALYNQEAIASAMAWYTSTYEPAVSSLGDKPLIKRTSVYPDPCTTNPIIKGFASYTYCGAGGPPAVTEVPSTITLNANPAKSSNPKLAEAFAQPANIINASQQPLQNGGVLITLIVAKQNGFNVYTIDTSYHSAINPIRFEDTAVRTVVEVQNLNLLR